MKKLLSIIIIAALAVIAHQMPDSKAQNKPPIYPKVGKKFVQSGDIANNAVTTEKLAPNAVTPEKLEKNAVRERNLAPGVVSTRKLQDGAVTAHKLADNAVMGRNLSSQVIRKFTNLEGDINKMANVIRQQERKISDLEKQIMSMQRKLGR